jgi:hypothetical protein
MSKLVFSFGQTISIEASSASMVVNSVGYPPYIKDTIATNSTEVLLRKGVTSTSATAPSKADIRAGAGTGTLEAFSHSITGEDAGDETNDLTSTSEAATYVHYFIEETRNPAFSSDVVTLGDGTSFGFDFTPPVLSGVSVTPGNAQLTLDYSTDKAEGNVTVVVVPQGATAPDEWQIVSKLNSDNALPEARGGSAISSTGAQTSIVLTGVTNGVAYDVHLAHRDLNGNIDTASVLNQTPTA